jgi:hypothetical protein
MKEWIPTDCTILSTHTAKGPKEDRIIIASISGLFEYKFRSVYIQTQTTPPKPSPIKVDVKESSFRRISTNSFYRVKSSSCGRILFATGVEEPIFLYEATSLLPICQIPSMNSRYFKVTGEQLFLKS